MFKNIYRIIFFVLSLLAVESATANATCVKPVFPPLTYERGNWIELETLKPKSPSHPDVIKRQDLAAHGHGKLNLDFFSITLDANGQSAKQLFDEIRANLSGTIYNGGFYDVQPLDLQQSAKWLSVNPVGALMLFTLAEIPNVMDVKRAGVFLACLSETSFTFSTYHSKSVGLHPVAGNRGFGVHDHGNGTLSIYVKAADRVVNEGIFGALPEVGREAVLGLGASIWSAMLDNIAKRYSDRNPQGKNRYSIRVAL